MRRTRWMLTVAVVGFAAWAGCGRPPAEQTPRPVGQPSRLTASGETPDIQPSPAQPVSRTAATFAKVREPAVAGLFYPRDRQQLAETVDKLLAKAEPAGILSTKRLRALVCPHAGYAYSGQTAAIAYKQLQGRQFETVIVMAPSHYADFQGASIADADAYATPLGTVPVSPRAAQLVGRGPLARNPPCDVARPQWWRQASKELPPFGEDTPHTWEHALEVQLPFMQRVLKGFAVVPIVFGRVDPKEVAEALSKVIDGKTLVVASSDLSHYHPYDVAQQLDASCTQAICDLDVDRMQEEEACGKLPVLALMHLAKAKGWKAVKLDYRNSGDVTGDKSAVVGYAAIAFFEPSGTGDKEPSAAAITAEDGRFLLELAVKSVEHVVRQGKLPEVDAAEVPKALCDPRACFVTLTHEGELRGCIGCIFPSEPLWQEVMRRAQYAATEDPRFPPVRPEELDELEVSVSVLSLPKPLKFQSPDDLVAKLRPGVDGVVLRVGGREATYLPQVWEQLPEPEAFLSHLSEKAGLEPSAWRSPQAVVLVYQVQAFKQGDKVTK